MKSANSKEKLFFRILIFILTIVSLAAMAKTLFVSIDIDESYAIAQSYRLAQGDRLLRDMWEPHQFSAYLSAIFIKLYLILFHSTDGLVIFLRLTGSMIHVLLGVALYFAFRRFASARTSLLLCFLHLNFLPKWIQTPEFELMQYWLTAVVFLTFLQFYLGSRRRVWLAVSGVCMLLQLFNYPTMILLYPFYIAGIVSLESSRKARLKNTGMVTLSAGIPGMVFLIYLLSYMTPREMLSNLTYILSDPSHTGANGLGVRLGGFALDFLKDLLFLGLLFLPCLLLAWLVRKLLHSLPSGQPLRSLCVSAALLESVLLCLYQMISCLLFDENQFFLQQRYLLFACIGLGLFVSAKNRTRPQRVLFWFAVVPSIVSVVASALLTNMSINTAYSKLFLCVPAVFLQLSAEAGEDGKDCVISYLVPVLALLGSLLVCKLVLIRVTGCLPVTMRANIQQMETGPLKGVYVTSELQQALSSDYALLSQYVTAEDNLFYFGCESLLYAGTDARISVASTLCSAVFNQDFLDYLELHPEKYPTVIAVDKTFPLTDAYHYNPYNYIVADWIAAVCANADFVDTDYMTIYFLGTSTQ